ncbi:hypothetical protein C4D60_Mb11t10010 [Musa balbisiana]|uniref:AP2/ERF domain-containing protein n=1 Tax=Musa balbisiana TaxID=52838 RepID=A0A4S8J369_MUSBA|nr:hypothetical protein C4D60_Mb11t10010 [Musa balbisiana]
MLRVTLQSEGEERGLETGHNWISYGLPPMEMLLRPCGFDLQASSDNDCAVAYNYQYFRPPPPAPASTELKLEDLLGGDSGAPCSETLTVDGQDTSSVSTVLIQDLRAVDDSSSAPSTGLENALVPPPQPPAAGHRTSVYRGVTRHRWTGRYEAHLWDNTCKREGQKRKGRQGMPAVFLPSTPPPHKCVRIPFPLEAKILAAAMLGRMHVSD